MNVDDVSETVGPSPRDVINNSPRDVKAFMQLARLIKEEYKVTKAPPSRIHSLLISSIIKSENSYESFEGYQHSVSLTAASSDDVDPRPCNC